MANPSPQLGVVEGVAVRGGSWREYLALAKWRLNAMVLLTTLIGYLLAAGGVLDAVTLINAMIGVWLAAVGASAINQYLERDIDARMLRTRTRPLPAGRLTERQALQFGTLCLVSGVLLLVFGVNLLAAFLCVVTAVTYLFVYTPLKRITPANTLVGAVPGALPPVIGWAAALGELSMGSWVLFAFMFCWQLPHFFAIAWMYREDYERARLPMLSGYDADGARTARHIVMCTLNLVFVSLLPLAVHVGGQPLAGPTYFIAAAVLGTGFLVLGLRFWARRCVPRARAVMFGSLIYLPGVLCMWLVDAL